MIVMGGYLRVPPSDDDAAVRALQSSECQVLTSCEQLRIDGTEWAPFAALPAPHHLGYTGGPETMFHDPVRVQVLCGCVLAFQEQAKDSPTRDFEIKEEFVCHIYDLTAESGRRRTRCFPMARFTLRGARLTVATNSRGWPTTPRTIPHTGRSAKARALW